MAAKKATRKAAKVVKRTAKKAMKLARARDPLAGSVDARTALEALDGPLTLGRLLRTIREGEGQTLEQMAKVLDVSRHHLSDVELGRRTASVTRAALWADKLGYSAAQFVRLALQAEVDAAGLNLSVSVAS